MASYNPSQKIGDLMVPKDNVCDETQDFLLALLRFLAPAQRDLFALAGTASLGINPKTKHSDKLDLSAHNISTQLAENRKRLELIESGLKEHDLDIHDIFTVDGLPKLPLQLPVEVLDISVRSIKKLKRNGVYQLANLYRDKLTLEIFDDVYYVNKHVQNYLNESLFLLSLPPLLRGRKIIQTRLEKLARNKKVLQFSPDEKNDHKTFMLPNILIYRFHDQKYRRRLDEKEVHILETVVWGNMRPDDAVSNIDGVEVGFLPFMIRLAGSKLIGN